MRELGLWYQGHLRPGISGTREMLLPCSQMAPNLNISQCPPAPVSCHTTVECFLVVQAWVKHFACMISFCFLSKHSHVSSLRFKFLVLLLLIFCLKVRDQEFPYRRNLARVIVNVEDANDHSPYFTNPLYEASVFESAALGSVVLQVTALDKDKGENAELIYSIEAGESCRDLSTKHDTPPSAAQPAL